MYQNYYQQSNTLKQPIVQQFGLKGRPVSSIDEVRAASIDFDGSVTFFPDLGNGKIYTKQIGLDGTAVLNMYELSQIPPVAQNDFVTRKEFEAVISKLLPPEQSKEKEYDF